MQPQSLNYSLNGVTSPDSCRCWAHRPEINCVLPFCVSATSLHYNDHAIPGTSVPVPLMNRLRHVPYLQQIYVTPWYTTPIFVLIWGYPQLCTGFTLGSALRDPFWRASGHHLGCQRVNSGEPHAKASALPALLLLWPCKQYLNLAFLYAYAVSKPYYIIRLDL